MPPQMIISLPVQTAVCTVRRLGALMVLVAVQLSVPGLYLPPVFKSETACLPSPDDHFTAGPDCCVHRPLTWRVDGAGGCPTIRAGIVSPAGVKRDGAAADAPPQTIISLPVHTAV